MLLLWILVYFSILLFINYTFYLPFPYVDRGMEEAESDEEKEVPNQGDATNQIHGGTMDGYRVYMDVIYMCLFFGLQCDYGISWCKVHIEFYDLWI